MYALLSPRKPIGRAVFSQGIGNRDQREHGRNSDLWSEHANTILAPNTPILSLLRTHLSYHCSERTYFILAPNTPILYWLRTHTYPISAQNTELSRRRTQKNLGSERRIILAQNAELSWIRTQKNLGSEHRITLAPKG